MEGAQDLEGNFSAYSAYSIKVDQDEDTNKNILEMQKTKRRRTICTICCLASCGVAAVMLPVSLYVIAPAVAQHNLDTVQPTITNATFHTCGIAPQAEIISYASVKSSFGVTVNEYTTRVSAYTCKGRHGFKGWYNCDTPVLGELGRYVSNEMKLSPGANTVSQSTALTLPSTQKENIDFLVNGVALPLLVWPHHQVRTVFSSDDFSVSIWGFKIGGLKLRKEVNCSYVGHSYARPEAKHCNGRKTHFSMGVVMKCTIGPFTGGQAAEEPAYDEAAVIL